MPDQPRQHRDGVRLDDELLVLGAEALGDHPGVSGLVILLRRKADREGLDPAGADPRHRRDHGARIDPARQKRAERHVGDQPQPHRLFQMRHQLVLQFGGAAPRTTGTGPRQLPIPDQLRLPPATFAVWLDHQIMRRRQAADALEGGFRRGDVLEGQILVDGAQVRPAADARPGQKRLDLGAEQQGRTGRGVIQRLLAEPVARQDQPARAPVPQCQREHAAHPVEDPRAPGVPPIGDDLGVAAAAEDIAERFEIAADLGEIVDLAVIGQPDRAVLAGDRLVRRG